MTALVAIFGALTLVGIVLTLKTLFPGRTGDTPHCRKCRYNLTGLDLTADDARCPECGSAVTETKAVLRGERHRRAHRVVPALVCLLLGLAPLVVIAVGALRQVVWYTYKPTGWVLNDIQSSDAKLAAKAVSEMSRRWQVDELTPEQVHRLAEACLAEQARPVERPAVGVTAVGLLDKLYELDSLTDEQSERFFTQMVQFTPLVRPIVVQGQPFYAGVRLRNRGPVSKYRVRVLVERIRVGTPPRVSLRDDYSYGGCTGYSERSLGRLIDFSRLGTHPVEVDLIAAINERGKDASWTGSPLASLRDASALYADRRTIKGSVEILPEEPPHLFTLTHSPELDRDVAAAVRATDFRREKETTWAAGLPWRDLSVEVWFHKPLPIGLAFVAYAEAGNRRLWAGQDITQSSGGSAGSRCGIQVSFAYLRKLPDTVTLILCASKSAATRTPDLYQIWDGELVFEDIPVSPVPRPDRRRFGEARHAPTVRHPEVSEPGAAGDGQP